MVLSNLRGSAGKHHRGKAPRRSWGHIYPTLLGTQTPYLSYAPWYVDAPFDLRSLVPEDVPCKLPWFLACQRPCGARARYQGALVKRPCALTWFRASLTPSGTATSHGLSAERRRGWSSQVPFPDSCGVDYIGDCRARQMSKYQVVFLSHWAAPSCASPVREHDPRGNEGPLSAAPREQIGEYQS